MFGGREHYGRLQTFSLKKCPDSIPPPLQYPDSIPPPLKIILLPEMSSSSEKEDLGSVYGSVGPIFLIALGIASLVCLYKRFRDRWYPQVPSQKYTPLSSTDFEEMVGGAFMEGDDSEDEEDFDFEIDGGGGGSTKGGYEMTKRKGKLKESPAVKRGVEEVDYAKRSQASIDFEKEFDELEKAQMLDD